MQVWSLEEIRHIGVWRRRGGCEFPPTRKNYPFYLPLIKHIHSLFTHFMYVVPVKSKVPDEEMKVRHDLSSCELEPEKSSF